MSLYKHHVIELLDALNHPEAFITDESRFDDFDTFNTSNKKLKKLKEKYKLKIKNDAKIMEIAEKMYLYRPF